MKRAPPEEPPDDDDDGGPLFGKKKDPPEDPETRVPRDMDRAHEHAEKEEPGWKDSAFASVRAYAEGHEFMISDDVAVTHGTPDEADARAWGAVMKRAERAGILKSHEIVRDKWGGWKTKWRSLIFRGSP